MAESEEVAVSARISALPFRKPGAGMPLRERALRWLEARRRPEPPPGAQQALLRAVKDCSVAGLRRALEQGAQPTLPWDSGHGDRKIALIELAFDPGGFSQRPLEDRLACLALLLPYCDPDAVDGMGRTAVMHAHSAAVVEKLAPVSDLRKRDHWGETALMIAARNGREDCVKLLLPGSDPKQVNLSGKPAIFLACQEGHAQIAKLLIPGSDLAYRSEDGVGLLAYAAMSKSDELVKLLLPLCDPKAADNSGWTPLHRAAQSGNPKSVALLLPVSDWGATTKDGSPALIWAKQVSAQNPSEEELAGMLSAIDDTIALRGALGSVAAAEESSPARARVRPRL